MSPRSRIIEVLQALEDAARELGIEPKRLLGYCMDPRPWMPISDGRMVYRWSLAGVRERVADTSAAVLP